MVIILVAGGVLGLVLCLPIERASLVSGMVVSVVASAAPVWLNRSGGGVRKRPTGRRIR
jgi:hypothetical protein